MAVQSDISLQGQAAPTGGELLLQISACLMNGVQCVCVNMSAWVRERRTGLTYVLVCALKETQEEYEDH